MKYHPSKLLVLFLINLILILEWYDRPAGKLLLFDDDGLRPSEAGWRKLNTLATYQVYLHAYECSEQESAISYELCFWWD